MKCLICNTPLEPGEKSCKHCGAAVDTTTSQDIEQLREVTQLQQEVEGIRHMQSMASRQQEQSHEMNMHSMRSDDSKRRLDAAQNLTPEQIMALAASDGLDKEAAAEFAKSLNSRKETELMRETANKLEELSQARVDDMKEVMSMFMAQSRDAMKLTGELASKENAATSVEATRVQAANGYVAEEKATTTKTQPTPPSKPDSGGSSSKYIILVVIIAAVAAAAYFLLGNKQEATPASVVKELKQEAKKVKQEATPQLKEVKREVVQPVAAAISESKPERAVAEIPEEAPVEKPAEVAQTMVNTTKTMAEEVAKSELKAPKVEQGKESYEAGLKAFEGERYNRAISLLKKAADEGSSKACRKLAEIYTTGVGGVAKNKMQAMMWQKKANKLERE